VQFVDGRYGEAIDFCPSLVVTFGITNGERTVQSARLAGATVDNGSWILKASDGTFSVKTHEEFESEYQP
jgi:hypothetical protein